MIFVGVPILVSREGALLPVVVTAERRLGLRECSAEGSSLLGEHYEQETFTEASKQRCGCVLHNFALPAYAPDDRRRRSVLAYRNLV